MDVSNVWVCVLAIAGVAFDFERIAELFDAVVIETAGYYLSASPVPAMEIMQMKRMRC